MIFAYLSVTSFIRNAPNPGPPAVIRTVCGLSRSRPSTAGRPVMMNGFLATSTPVGLQQWWRTRDQGDSLAVAQRLADIVGVDFYPRHALASAGPLSVYLDGSQARSRRRQLRLLLGRAAAAGRGL